MTAAWASQAPHFFKFNETAGECVFDALLLGSGKDLH